MQRFSQNSLCRILWNSKTKHFRFTPWTSGAILNQTVLPFLVFCSFPVHLAFTSRSDRFIKCSCQILSMVFYQVLVWTSVKIMRGADLKSWPRTGTQSNICVLKIRILLLACLRWQHDFVQPNKSRLAKVIILKPFIMGLSRASSYRTTIYRKPKTLYHF